MSSHRPDPDLDDAPNAEPPGKPPEVTRYEAAFAHTVGAMTAHAFYKGRVALYAILRCLGVSRGDRVIFPGFTCIMVPNAAAYLGATPVYVDIDPSTLNIAPDRLDAALDAMPRDERARVRAIVVQHTFGIPADVDAVSAIALRYGIPLVEDCAHALGSRYAGKHVGTFGTAAFFSSQWSKPYSTGLGGMAVTSDASLARRVSAVQSEAVEPTGREATSLALQMEVHRRFFTPRLYWTAMKVLHVASSAGLFIGSSSRDEYDIGMPEGYLKRMGVRQAVAGAAALRRVEEDLQARARNTAFYDGQVPPHATAVRPKRAEPVLLRYPVFVTDKEAVLREARRRSAEVGSWFETPLHPARVGLEKLGYARGMCPEGERVAARIVNLPTHRRVEARDAIRALEVVRPYLHVR